MIRNAEVEDLESILKIYEYARDFMKSTGNTKQWGDHFPSKELLEKDIMKRQLYVYEEDGIHAVFAFIIGDDDTYQVIEDGKWLSNDLYGTIHRVASDGTVKGVLSKIVEFCEKKISHLRIDTHFDNKIMQHLIEKNGFQKCGIIYVADGSPRFAYERL
jgi:hypothetical protein